MELRPYQQQAVEAVYNHLRTKDNNPCVVLPVGCHAVDHPILMFDGTIKKVQDVAVGDVIMGADSTPRRVLALARGREEMYRIVPNKGAPFVVNASHILSLVCTSEGKPFPSSLKGGEIDNISVRDYLAKSKSWKSLRKLYRVPVEFSNHSILPIPPYILGLLLGDGCLRNGVEYTTADEELGNIFEAYAQSIGCNIRVVEKEGTKCLSYYLTMGKEDWRGHENVFVNILREMGLFEHTAARKFIPHEYLTASREERLNLLAGLIDTDGYCDKTIDYITKSRELSDDITFLARSLGFMANCIEKYCSCQTGAGGWYYRICISGDLAQIPCRRNKHDLHGRKQKKDVLRTGFVVESAGIDDFYGFELDGDHLYVDGNFFVHHNTGKSICIGKIATDAIEKWNGRVLILAHVKELLEQNADKIKKLCPTLDVGIYSAGLESRDTTNKVIVAGIQSVYNKAEELGHFDLAIVDECHLIPESGEGRYRTFFASAKKINPLLRVIGFTATPYRLQGGLICKPENILNEVCFEAPIKEMIANGYLSPLTAKAGRAEANLENVHIRGGEFIEQELASAMDQETLVNDSCKEIVKLTKDRKTVLIFATSVEHCKHVAAAIEKFSGQECAIVTGDTPADERSEIIQRIRGEYVQNLLGEVKPPLKYVANVNVLAVGFDAPNIDCVVLLRPTMSPGLLIQMVGRSTRLSPQTGKTNALILDYGGNIIRHGPIDRVRVKEKGEGGGGPLAKTCPNCRELIPISTMLCPVCGHEYPRKARELKHDVHAADVEILSGPETKKEVNVDSVCYYEHEKHDAPPGTPKTLRVVYRSGLQFFSEWLCPEHDGYARRKFEDWWRRHAPHSAMPDTVEQCLWHAKQNFIRKPTKITVRQKPGESFTRITNCVFSPNTFIKDEDPPF